MIRRIMILGAAGDLATRYLFPALARLHEAGRLPEGFRAVGLARTDWDDGEFRAFIGEHLDRNAKGVDAAARRELLRSLDYQRADVTRRDQVLKALENPGEPVVAYLALPPAVFGPTIEALTGLPEGSRIVLEKPFGENLQSARKLNGLLHESFPEDAVFRADHFLALQPVQNLLGLRFANRVLEPLWSREHIDAVEIVWDETLALEGRASYYDRAGALTDVIQNHLLQVLCLIGMEPPDTLSERDVRDRKAEALRAVHHLSPEEVQEQTLRARYSAGRIGNRETPAYAREEGIDPARETETYARITLAMENRRWAGVPFVLRTGKALARDRHEVCLHFKPVSRSPFEQQPQRNVLRLPLDASRITLDINTGGRGGPLDLERACLRTEPAQQELPAYGRLLLGALEGDPTFFVRADEAEESWRIVEPILRAWREGRTPLLEYPAGSAGPE